MKGYRMVLFVNGGLFFLLSLLTLFYAQAVERQADECVPPEPGRPGPDCEQVRGTSRAAYAAAPWLFASAVLLLGAGAATAWVPPREGTR